MLDLGCGLGDFTAAMVAAGVQAAGCDVAGEAVRRAQERHPGISFVQSGEDLPFEDELCDAVWAGEVLEHVQDVLGLLAEVHRILRPGGRLIASTPDHNARRRLALGLSRRAFEANFDPHSDHVRFFTSHSLRRALENAGFAEVRITSAKRVLLAVATRT